MPSATASTKKVDQKLRYKGYRVLVSDEISDAGKAWCAYQERWIVEDTFKTLISGTPAVVKHFRIKFSFSLVKQDLFA